MPSIIRATERQCGTSTAAFNFVDMSVQAQQYLAKVRTEAAQLLAGAQQEAEAIRRRAEADGRQAGLQDVEAMIQKQLATAFPALQQAIRDIHDAKHAWLRHWEASTVHLAAAIAGQVIRREVQQDPKITVTLVREALELASGNANLRIHLHPEDCKALGNQVQSLIDELAPLAEAEIVPNPDVTTGGCRVETRFGVIDQQFEAQLKRIEEELTQ